MLIRIRRIKVGERRREEMGDIANLAESIKRHGLIQPIVVDADLNLVAGGRRLRACQLLGWERIEVRRLGELSGTELREIELEENERRKDLTDYERSKNMLRRAEVAAEVLREQAETLPDSGKVSRQGTRGPQPRADSQQRVAERMGTSQQRVSEAQSHVSTAEEFPFMQDWRQYWVLEAKEYIEKLPEEEYRAITDLLSQPALPPGQGASILKNLTSKTPEQRAEIYQRNRSNDPHEREQALTVAADLPPMPDQRIVLTQEARGLLRKAADLSNDAYQEELIWVCMRLMVLEHHMAESVK